MCLSRYYNILIVIKNSLFIDYSNIIVNIIPLVIAQKTISGCVKTMFFKNFYNLLSNYTRVDTGIFSFFIYRILKHELPKLNFTPSIKNFVRILGNILFFSFIRRIDCTCG